MNLKNVRVCMAHQLNIRIHYDTGSKKANMIFGSIIQNGGGRARFSSAFDT